ncbi:ABC transporter ATP-binding protein [Porticoccus sp.]
MKLPPVISVTRRGLLLRLVGNGFLQALVTVAITLLIKSTFDNYLNGSASPAISLWHASLGFLCATAVVSWLGFRERLDSECIGQDYVHELRIKMFAKYCNGDLRKLEQQSKGAISLRFATDLSALRQWISLGLSRLIVAGVNLVIALSMLCYINFILGFSVTLIVLASALLSFSTGKKLRYTFVEARRKRSFLANNINEKVSSLATVKVFGQRQREKNRVKRQSERLMAAMFDRARAIGLLRAITEGSTVLASSMVLIVGALLMSSNQATPGTVVAALGVVNLLMQPLRHLGRIYEYRLNASVAEEKIKSFLDTRPSVLTRHRRERRGQSELRLKEAAFFSNSEVVSLGVKPGTTIAILGVNGAGKSTILSQVAGLLKPSSGKILLGKNDVCKLKDSALRQSIGMVSHNLPLLKGSIRNNICYRRPNATEDEINLVVKRCGLAQLLDSLPDGLETKLKEAGQNLSQGERQRIALARALIGTPELLILDEADAFLDDEATALFLDIIRGYPGIVIMATHNIEHVVMADQIWLIDNGALCWNGPREELPMNLYAELFEAKATVVGSRKAEEGADV